MSYVQPANSTLNPIFDEHRWVMQIRRTLEEEVQDADNDVHVSIFDVPKALKIINPNAYTPQLVSFGPYHYCRIELKQMERYKVSSAKRIQNQNRGNKFQIIVDHFTMLEPRIRACYHKYLDLNGETLAWMMAIDAAFLLEIINAYTIKEDMILTRVSFRMSHLVDYIKREETHSVLLRDIIMLENQIPLFVLREMLGFQLSSLDLADKKLIIILTNFYKDLSPFKISNDPPRVQTIDCEHIIDFFYQVMVPQLEEAVDITSNDTDQEANEEKRLCKFLLQVKDCLGLPFRNMLKLCLLFICNLPGFTILRTLIFSNQNHSSIRDNANNSRSSENNEPPLVEEIMIPSVFELSTSGVIFMPTNGDIMNIKFESESKKFYLPTISMNHNSEVLLRNLVAYEASNISGPLVFARYTELMNGIIDTKDDVKLLRENGIILNYLKSDEEVANLWNGMSKSLRLTRVPFLDEVIENVNKYYEGNWRVRTSKFLKACATNSWQFLACMVAVLLLFLLTLQALCSFFYCFRILGAHHRR